MNSGLSGFSLGEQNGAWWLRTPDGKRLFSFGVCVVDQGQKKAQYNEKNPGYASFRYYPDSASWAKDATTRLRSWGFNTVGAWSDDDSLLKAAEPDTYFTPILHMGSSAGAPWRDMWDPAIVKTMDDVAGAGIRAHRDDPRIVGYFSDNELGWWTGALFDWAWKGRYSRQRVVDVISKAYGGSWSKLSVDFVAVGAGGFAGLRKSGRLYLRPGGKGMVAVHKYISVLADRYYFLCDSIIKKHDPRALFLGDRYISGFYPEVAVAAGKYADVVSTNLNADWNDGTFAPFYLPTLERLTHRPLMITEYYVAAAENRSGNRNDSSGFPVVATQKQRAAAFLRSTEALLHTPYVVGAHWFQYYDEPGKGRGDGENYDMGLVDAQNQPYKEITSTAASLDLDREHSAGPDPFAGDTSPNIPTSPSDPSRLETWAKTSYLVRNPNNTRGDAFVCRSDTATYLALYWNEDRFFEALYKDQKVPAVDEPSALIRGFGKPIRIRFVGSKPSVIGPCSIVRYTPGVRTTAILKIPTKRSSGCSIKLLTRGRAYEMSWKARF
jgi:hypothetical protein